MPPRHRSHRCAGFQRLPHYRKLLFRAEAPTLRPRHNLDRRCTTTHMTVAGLILDRHRARSPATSQPYADIRNVGITTRLQTESLSAKTSIAGMGSFFTSVDHS